ncbi:MAG: hypothetical protein P8X96_04340 [Desulfobacteraceae bacterium]
MSDLAALQNTLQSAVSNQELVLNGSLLDATLLAPFPKNTIPLQAVAIKPASNKLVVTGELKEDWAPGGPAALTLANLALTLTFMQSGNKVQAAFAFTGQVRVDAKTLQIAGSVEAGKLVFGLKNGQKLSLVALASLVSNGEMDAQIPPLAFLNSVSVETFDLTFGWEKGTDTEIEIVVGSDKRWKIVGDTIAATELKCRLQLTYQSTGDGYALTGSGAILGTVQAGIVYQVEAPFASGEALDIIITAKQGNATPGILDIAKLIGGSDLRATMKSALNAVKLTDLSIDKLAITFDLKTKKPSAMQADGHMTLAGVDAGLSVKIPGGTRTAQAGWIITVGIAGDGRIPIGKLADDLSKRYGKVDLPDVLDSVTLSSISLRADTKTQAVAVGFDTQLTLSAQTRLDTHVDISVAKSGNRYATSFSGDLLLAGLRFGLDFSSAPNTASFCATYDGSQNAPENEGKPGYDVRPPSTGKLYDAMAKVFPKALTSAIPGPLKQALNAITLSGHAIEIAGVGAVTYEKISLGCSKSGNRKNWKVGFVGGIAMAGIVDMRGDLEVAIGERNQVSFITAADSGELPVVPVPVPAATPPTIAPRFKALQFTRQGSDFSFSSTVAIQFLGFTGVMNDILPDETDAVLTLKNQEQTFTVTRLTEGLEIPLPKIPVPGGSPVDLGRILVNISDFTITNGAKPGLSLNLDLGLPSKLNNVFGTRGGKPVLPLFNTYDPANPRDALVKIKVQSDGRKLSASLLTSPLKAVKSVVKDGKAWWAIDMGDFGAAEIMVPEFSYTAGSSGLTAAGGFHITRPLSIPLMPLKWFVQAVAGKKAAEAVPTAVPIQEINILDADDNLNIGEFKKLWGGHFPGELEDALEVIDKGIHKLPDRLKSYFNIQIPNSLMFDIQVDAGGGIQGGLSVGPDDPPVRILYPGMAGPLPALNGLELRRVCFGEILSGQLFTLDVDATFDQFNLLTIAASLVMPNSDLKILPKSQTLQNSLELKNLFALIFYQAGVPIPIPLFYDKIGIDYLGFEGLAVGSHFRLPKPTPNMVELAKMLGQLVEFFTDPKYLLDVSKPPKQSDIKFTIGGNYLQLPKYTGGKLLGQKGVIQEISAWKLLAHALNWLKTFSVNEFIQSFPIQYRVGSETVSFFNVAAINVAWALTTPYEFSQTAYKKLKLKEADKEGVLAVLPEKTSAHDQGLVLLMSGGFNIANAVTFQTTLGMMGSSAHGFATGFQIKGRIAGIVAADLAGAIALDPKSQPAFQLLGKTRLEVLRQTVMDGELYLSNQKLIVSGHLDLFPNVKLVDASADIEGEISDKKLNLTGQTNFSFGSGSGKVTIINGQMVLTHDRFYIQGQFLALKTTLEISSRNNDLMIAGEVGTKINLPVSTGPIRIAGVKVADGLSLNLKTGLTLAVAVTEDTFTLGVAAVFTLNGKGFDVTFSLHVVPGKIAEVTEALVEEILDRIGTYFRALYKDAAAWSAGVAKGAIELAENTAGNAAAVFKNVYKTATGEATALLKDAGYAVEEIGGALNVVYDQTEQQVAKLMKGAGYAAEDVGKALASAFSASARETAKFLKGAGYVAEDIGKALQSVFNTSEEEAAKILKGIGFTAEQVGRALASVFKQTAAQAARILKGIGYAADQVGKAMQSAYKQSAQQAAKLLKRAGYGATQVGKALKSVFRLNATQAAKALKGAGYLVNDVGKAMKSVFNASSSAAAAALKAAGYSANQVGSALKTAFSASANEAAKALKAAGYTVGQVGGALKGTFTNSAASAASALKAAGYTAQQAAGVMKNTFKASANEVANAMKTTYGLGGKAVESVLKGVKYSTGAVSKAMKDIFNIIPHIKLPHVKHVKIPHVKLW